MSGSTQRGRAIAGRKRISGFSGGKKKSQTRISTTTYNHLTSINSVIDNREDDGNVLIARELLDALLPKICWGILTP